MLDSLKIYYWYCPICGKDKTYVEGFKSVKEAVIELEKHEADVHKKKQVGNFGVYYLDKYITK